MPSKKKRSLRRYLWLLPLVGLGALLLQPRWFFTLAAQVKPGALYAVDLPDTAPKIVALTIDDGPSEDTLEILETLDRYGAKATFFSISGNIAGHEKAIAQAVKSGHELGNHLTADEPSAKLSLEDFEADLLAAESVLSPYLKDQQIQWLRPGMGWYSADMVKIARKHGYKVALGSCFPYDTHVPSVRFASTFILNTVKPGDIIVLHDGKEGRSQRTTATLEKILPVLAERGYQVTTLSALTQQKNSPKDIIETSQHRSLAASPQ